MSKRLTQSTDREIEEDVSELFLPESIEVIILEMTNVEAMCVYEDTWRENDLVDLQAYIGQ